MAIVSKFSESNSILDLYYNIFYHLQQLILTYFNIHAVRITMHKHSIKQTNG